MLRYEKISAHLHLHRPVRIHKVIKMYEKMPINDKLIKITRIYEVPIEKIVQNKALLREYDTVSVVKLASSIRKIGLIEPIILRLPCHALPCDPEIMFKENTNLSALPCPQSKKKLTEKLCESVNELKTSVKQAKIRENEEKYVLISGGYRLRAYKMLGYSHIPARFALYTENDEASIQMVTEFFGSCSDIFERARKFVRTCIDLGMNACELAENLGFQRKYALSLFNIAKMSDSEADLASLHKLSFETIANIAKVNSPMARLALIDEAKERALSETELLQKIDDANNGRAKSMTQDRRLFCKDMRIYMNTLKKTVSAMVENGIDAKLDVKDNSEATVMTITVMQPTKANAQVNVSRETLKVSVEESRIVPTETHETVENPMETVEKVGVSCENQEKSSIICDFEAKQCKTVENRVENVENIGCVTEYDTSVNDIRDVDAIRQDNTANAYIE